MKSICDVLKPHVQTEKGEQCQKEYMESKMRSKIRKRPTPMPIPSKALSTSTWVILQVQRSKAYRNSLDNAIRRGSIK